MTTTSSLAIGFVQFADRPVTTPRDNFDFSEGEILRGEFSRVNRAIGDFATGEYRLWFANLMDAVTILVRYPISRYAGTRWEACYHEALAWVKSTDYYVGSFSFVVGEVLGWSVTETRRILLTDPRGVKERLDAVRNKARRDRGRRLERDQGIDE
jgi:hypothetical protein